MRPNFPSIVATCEKVYRCEVVFGVYLPKYQSVVINHLVSHSSKEGNGSKCMAYLINTLERYGIRTIEIVAMPVPCTTGPDTETLIKWYQKFGFVVIHRTMVGCHIFSADMELSFLPPKLVAARLDRGSPETSTGKGLQPPTA